MPTLEQIQEKFDFCRKELANGFYEFVNESFLINFSGTLLEYCKSQCPFESWYNNIEGSVLRVLNRILLKHGKSKLTKEELKIYYNHVFQNNIMNSIK